MVLPINLDTVTVVNSFLVLFIFTKLLSLAFEQGLIAFKELKDV